MINKKYDRDKWNDKTWLDKIKKIIKYLLPFITPVDFYRFKKIYKDKVMLNFSNSHDCYLNYIKIKKNDSGKVFTSVYSGKHQFNDTVPKYPYFF